MMFNRWTAIAVVGTLATTAPALAAPFNAAGAEMLNPGMQVEQAAYIYHPRPYYPFPAVVVGGILGALSGDCYYYGDCGYYDGGYYGGGYYGGGFVHGGRAFHGHEFRGHGGGGRWRR